MPRSKQFAVLVLLGLAVQIGPARAQNPSDDAAVAFEEPSGEGAGPDLAETEVGKPPNAVFAERAQPRGGQNIRSFLDEEPLPESEEEAGVLRRLRNTEAELNRLRAGLQSGRISGGVIFPGRDPDSPQPFAPRLSGGGAAEEEFPNISVSGFFQADTGFFGQDAASFATFGPIQNGADFRRARLSLLGSAAPNINYIMEMDFAQPGHPTFKDVWAEVTMIPIVGNVRVGFFKAPFSLEELQSARQLEFLERALPVTAFAPFRRLGILTYNYDQDGKWTWQASFTRALAGVYGDDIGNSGGWAGTARGTILPYYDEPSEGRYYFHLGAAYQLAYPGQNVARFASIPEAFIGSQQTGGQVGSSDVSLPGPLNGTPFFVDAPVIANSFGLYGLEMAGSLGSFNFQSEWIATTVNQINNPQAFMQGAYFQASYFLTGEHRPYVRPSGTLGSILPFENFFIVGRGRGMGRGAWEVASRISWADLDSRNIQGGRLVDYTAGLNWYLHANVKLQFNYIHAWLDNPIYGRSNTDIFISRLQAKF
jgi:phosphate-selective porin OprO/OprP